MLSGSAAAAAGAAAATASAAMRSFLVMSARTLNRVARESSEPPERLDPLAAVDARSVDRAGEDLDRAVVGGPINGEQRAVLAAVSERVARRAPRARRRAVHELGYERERAQRLGTDALDAQELLEV